MHKSVQCSSVHGGLPRNYPGSVAGTCDIEKCLQYQIDLHTKPLESRDRFSGINPSGSSVRFRHLIVLHSVVPQPFGAGLVLGEYWPASAHN